MKELQEIIEDLPRCSKIKVLDTQLAQATRTLLNKRLEAAQERSQIFALILSKISEASMALLRNVLGVEQLIRVESCEKLSR